MGFLCRGPSVKLITMLLQRVNMSSIDRNWWFITFLRPSLSNDTSLSSSIAVGKASSPRNTILFLSQSPRPKSQNCLKSRPWTGESRRLLKGPIKFAPGLNWFNAFLLDRTSVWLWSLLGEVLVSPQNCSQHLGT